LETENTTLRVRHKWTNDELALLKKLWESDMPSQEIAETFGVSYFTIKKVASKHGFRRPIHWKPQEIEILKKYYSKLPRDELQRLLPKRSWISILAKAEGLGLTRSLLTNLKPTDFSFLTDAEKGYIAGIIDGEGTISLEKRKFSNVKIHPVISISNCSLELLYHIQKIIKCGTVRLAKKANQKTRPEYKLSINRISQIEGLLRVITPYLMLKRKQAEIVLEFISRLRKKGLRNYKLSKYEMALLKEIRMLNQRGNPPAENPLLEP
jgi:hypothetical protein